jgi:hypothetical protein
VAVRWRRSLAAVELAVALQCYDLRDARGLWQGVAVVSEDEWRFDVYDQQGRRLESGAADALAALLKQRGLVDTARPCTAILIQCLGRATRC